MTQSEANELLLAHAGMSHDPNHPGLGNGFLGMLRPYKKLHEHNFHEVMLALQTVAPLLENAMVDRWLIGALWDICHFGRAWALEEGSMLERNNLISPADAALLSEWLNIISYAVASLLDDTGMEEAFAPYRYYLADNADAAPTSV